MAYGFEIYTSEGYEFISQSGEEAMQYWGTVYFTGTEVVTPFYIPSNVFVQVYSSTGELDEYLVHGTSGGYHSYFLKKGNTNVEPTTPIGACRLYVFVRARDMPRQEYGLEVYDESGNITFSSVASPMVFSHIVNGFDSALGYSKTLGRRSYTPLYDTISDNLGFESEEAGASIWRWWSKHLQGHTDGTINVIGDYEGIDSFEVARWDFLGNSINIPCIDYAYYNTIPNRPNW